PHVLHVAVASRRPGAAQGHDVLVHVVPALRAGPTVMPCQGDTSPAETTPPLGQHLRDARLGVDDPRRWLGMHHAQNQRGLPVMVTPASLTTTRQPPHP